MSIVCGLLSVIGLVTTVITDFRRGIILRAATILPAFVIFLYAGISHKHSWSQLIFSVLFGIAFFWLPYFFSQGKWVGIGDSYLGALIGAIFVWPNVWYVILGGYVLGLIMVGLQPKKPLQSNLPVPIGAFVALSGLLGLIFL